MKYSSEVFVLYYTTSFHKTLEGSSVGSIVGSWVGSSEGVLKYLKVKIVSDMRKLDNIFL